MDKHALYQQSRSIGSKIWWIKRVHVSCMVFGRRLSALRGPHTIICEPLPTERLSSLRYNPRASSGYFGNYYDIRQYIPSWLVRAPNGRQADSTVWSRGLHQSLLSGNTLSRWIRYCSNLAREESHLSQSRATKMCELLWYDQELQSLLFALYWRIAWASHSNLSLSFHSFLLNNPK